MTVIGEGGITLSGGQRQRLAIARSIVSRPPILIFDEATSSIDVRSEKVVQTALDRISKHRTTIMIAHRLSTIRRADNIIVMKDGTNVEEGTHEDLIYRGGAYYSMVHAQQLEPLTAPEEDKAESDDLLIPKEEIRAQEYPTDLSEQEDDQQTEHEAKKFGFFHSFWVIASEQRHHWILYIFILVGAMGVGCKCYISLIRCRN